ncbi:hypothetical protein DUNSADRAFT_8180 [Dunaliella salina]|uniref:CMP/dCMP-type deaminase domain-containing protein n=1 Tax=Dunaliella salina TaxID=3046 RepID=A0ABQ7GK12_DUNSA|nr:hypothetical protein DUNSADRAFT_8180 [Dunaliella salina]|eukprot:KAF5834909.1 hypothetical protein DUNSADRAFT_8180 [Dunaliella salina]
MFPCNECAKLLIQAGIKEVVFNEGKVQPDCGGLAQGCSQHSLDDRSPPSATRSLSATPLNKSMPSATRQSSATPLHRSTPSPTPQHKSSIPSAIPQPPAAPLGKGAPSATPQPSAAPVHRGKPSARPQLSATPLHESTAGEDSSGMRPPHDEWCGAGNTGHASGHGVQAAAACHTGEKREERGDQAGESGGCGIGNGDGSSCDDGVCADAAAVPIVARHAHCNSSGDGQCNGSGDDSKARAGRGLEDGVRKGQQGRGFEGPLPRASNGVHGPNTCAGIHGHEASCSAADGTVCASDTRGSGTLKGVVGVSEQGPSICEGGKGETRAMEKSAMDASYRASLKLLMLAGVQLRQHCLARTVVLSGVGISS